MSDDNFGPWIDWAGGECPIPNTRAGEWWLRWKTGGEERAEMDASDFVWVDRGPAAAGDIIAYRVRLPAEDLLRQAIEALRELTVACVEDFGDGEDYGDGDEPVGGGRKEDGTPDPMAVTFGHIRKARGVLTAYDKRSA